MGSVAFRFSEKMEQNFLNQFSNDNIYANVARGSVLLQLFSIFPFLVAYLYVDSIHMRSFRFGGVLMGT